MRHPAPRPSERDRGMRRNVSGADYSSPRDSTGARAHPVSRMTSMISTTSRTSLGGVSHASADPAAGLSELQQQTRSIEVVVALNSIGVVSEYSDCVLLSNDLNDLGQALELAV